MILIVKNTLIALGKKLHLREKAGWLKKLLLSAYHRTIKPNTAIIRGVRVPIGDHISQTVIQAIYDGEYEHGELYFLRSRLNSDDIVMELGTGIGLLSCYAAKIVGSQNVFTYEANPSLEKPIRQLYQMNNVNPHLECCMLGEQEGEHNFYIEKDFWASTNVKGSEESIAVKVPVKSFNEAIRQINPSFLIIDIEGGEYELINYADLHNVRKLIIEVHRSILGNDKVESVIAKLSELGFKIEESVSESELFFQR